MTREKLEDVATEVLGVLDKMSEALDYNNHLCTSVRRMWGDEGTKELVFRIIISDEEGE